MLIVGEGCLFPDVPQLENAVDRASDYLMLVDPLNSHQA